MYWLNVLTNNINKPIIIIIIIMYIYHVLINALGAHMMMIVDTY